MAWVLRFDGVNDNVQHDVITFAGEFNVEFKFEYRTTKTNQTLFGGGSATAVRVNNTGSVLLRMGGTSVTRSFNTALIAGTTYTFILERDAAGNIDLTDEFGASLINAKVLKTGNLSFDNIGSQTNGGANFAEIDLYYAKYIDNATTVNLLDSSASSGAGSILPDTVGSKNGVLVGFPTDNSQWISTGGGGSITADVNLSVNKPVFSVQVSKSEPSFNASLSFEVGKPVFSVQAGNTIPGSGATVSLNIASPVFSVQAAKEDPPPAPTRTADVNFTVSKPVFSVQASNLGVGNSANVNLTIPKPQFSVQASRTIPDTIADADITISGPIFTIYAGTDSDSFHYANGAITYISTESKTVSLPSQSRVVTIKSIK